MDFIKIPPLPFPPSLLTLPFPPSLLASFPPFSSLHPTHLPFPMMQYIQHETNLSAELPPAATTPIYKGCPPQQKNPLTVVALYQGLLSLFAGSEMKKNI